MLHSVHEKRTNLEEIAVADRIMNTVSSLPSLSSSLHETPPCSFLLHSQDWEEISLQREVIKGKPN